MGEITFILGGARSGKSRHALDLARVAGKPTTFIATARPDDREMARRIARHKKERPTGWTTVEAPLSPSAAVRRLSPRAGTVIVDCLTLLISNHLLETSDAALDREIGALLSALKKIKADALVVSNEVGLGVVPGNALARRFRDAAGRVHQRMAREASRVIFMVAGIPWRVK